MTAKSRLTKGVEFLYVLVKSSLFFWGTLIKMAGIYGWVSAQEKTMYAVDHPEAVHEGLSRITENLGKAKLWEKTLSVGIFLSFAGVIGTLVWGVGSSLSVLFLVASGILLLFLLLLTTNFLVTPKAGLDFATYSYLVLSQTLRPSLWNGFVVANFVFWALLLPISPLLFFLVAPGGVFYLLKKGYQKLLELKGQTHDSY
ncbi:hypothetical protein P7H31_01255 [Enterococcus asini]|uniref:hypothetical protein n=1 Tax=Enterococcus asini TaxID=57732 RepID=UPI001386D8FE|nr:hypothetical protein [Enterococcus asini]MDT2762951.1 hypothetical protein [Enterococcus asini]